MNVLVIDVGGTNIKIPATGQKQFRKFPSGITLSAKQMVEEVKKLDPEERLTIAEVYQNLVPINFSKQILERIAADYPGSIYVLPVNKVYWSELGSRERVLRVRRRLTKIEAEKRKPQTLRRRHENTRR